MLLLKKIFKIKVLSTFILFLNVSLYGSAMDTCEDVELIPREIFFVQGATKSVKISPDGKRISFLKPYEGISNIWIQNSNDQEEAIVVTKSPYPIRRYYWAQNNEQILFLRDFGGDENYHLYSLDLKNLKTIDLTPYDKVQARLMQKSEEYPDEIVVAINNRDPAYHDLWIVNTRTGERRLIFENKEEFGELFVDNHYQLRLGKKSDTQGGFNVFIRDANVWKPFLHFSSEDSISSRILGFSADNTTLYYLDSTGSDTSAFYSFNMEDKNVQKIASEKNSNISDVFFDSRTKKPLIALSEYLRMQYTILDKSIEKDFEYLKQLSDGDLNFLGSSLDSSKWIVEYIYDNKPAHFYLYDRPKKSARFLFSANPEIEKFALSTKEPVLITSRDGLPLVSYLSLPRQGPRKNIPLVLWVHGGPWARDDWGYEVVHQWLNNRDYAVLSVNFRGSEGLGKKFMNAGNLQWSKKMHDDLIDAVNWSIEKGIANPKKICIGGGSYGGYATLVGLTSTPDVFACGVDIVGPSNIETLLANSSPYEKDAFALLEDRVGRLDDKEFLRSISPLYQADKISKPLLIAQGKNDVRVKENESTQIVEAMKLHQKPVLYVLFPDEGHGFAKVANYLAFYAIMEAFLAKELGGRFQAIGDEVKNSSALILEGAEILEGLQSGCGSKNTLVR